MIYLNKNRPETILTWDWKEQPNWGEIDLAISNMLKFNLKPVFIEFETGSDEHGLMIAPEGFNSEIAKMYLDNIDSFYPAE